MTERYTKNAKTALELARASSGECGHSHIGSEHLLLGLLREKEGTAATVLREAGVLEEKMMELITQLVDPWGQEGVPQQEEADRQGKKSRQRPQSNETAGKKDGSWQDEMLRWEGLTPRVWSILKCADQEAEAMGMHETGTEHLLLALIEDIECVGARLLHTMGVDLQVMYRTLLDILDAPDERSRDLMRNVRTAGDDMGMQTPFLDQFSTDLTQRAKEGNMDPIVGREREMQRILQILCRKTKNNPCLIGEPGVGKTAIVEGLAMRIVKGDVPPQLQGRRVVTLDMASMVAGTKYRGEFEERMKHVLEEVVASQDVLLFIDELHTIIGAGGAEGSLDASNIMKPSLSRGDLQVIGATTVTEYRKYVEKDAALERRFQPVMVEEPSEKETVQILQGIREAYEAHHGVVISDEALLEAVRLSIRYLNDRFLPDKAIDLMDEAAARRQLEMGRPTRSIREKEEEKADLEQQLEEALFLEDTQKAQDIYRKMQDITRFLEKERKRAHSQAQKTSQVTRQDIAGVISVWTGIPAQRIAQSEGKRLLNLEKTLHGRVVGQEEAVLSVARAIKRGRAGLKDPKRPIGSFLFLGPTGVGKTELSKALAAAVFGSEQSMIRVDMSEYMEKHSVSKLVGPPPGYVGYEEGGQLSDQVRTHPYSVVLFDEIEKAHPDVFNILLQVLDEGHITDSQGRRVDFKNTVLIMTSNAGAQNIQAPKHLGFGAGKDAAQNYEKMKAGVMEEIRRIFRPEFLNRIDDCIVFHSLTKEEIAKIASMMLQEVAVRCKEQMSIRLKVSAAMRDFLVEKGYDEKYGARPLKRAIQTYVEDPLAEEILAGRVKEGTTVVVSRKAEKTHFSVQEPGRRDPATETNLRKL